MDTSDGSGSPKFSFCDGDDGGRAKIKPYIHISKFRTGDKVYFRLSDTAIREGPYLVSSVPSAGRYTLSLEDGQPVKNGDEVDEKDLESA